MEYVQLSLDDYIQCKSEIKENLTGIVKSFVKIGWQLTRINASKAYTLDGYNSITEFAKAEYDMNPDGVSRFMNVYERYSVPGDTPELQEQYKDFKFAQLSEAMKVVNMIQEAYASYKGIRTILTGITTNSEIVIAVANDKGKMDAITEALKEAAIFQMPQDSEVV